MINRVLIRLKIIQIVYAYYQNGSKNLDSAEKELFFSLSKAYDLYNYLLMLMMALTEYAQKRIDAAKAKLAPTKEELYPNTKFVDNKFVAQLEVNKQLTEFISNQKRTWANDQDFVKPRAGLPAGRHHRIPPGPAVGRVTKTPLYDQL